MITSSSIFLFALCFVILCSVFRFFILCPFEFSVSCEGYLLNEMASLAVFQAGTVFGHKPGKKKKKKKKSGSFVV